MHDIHELIEYYNENDFLDFKQEEYNDDNKPHLLKDVLSLANGNRVGNRYIIIGVSKKDNQTTFWNIESKFDSAHIQQYIHANITPEIEVDYTPYLYKNYNFMILTIKNPNSQPYMIKKDVHYKGGKICLKANECWVRKGSYQVTATRKDFDRMYQNTASLEKSVEVTFHNGKTVLECEPKFNQQKIYYRDKQEKKLDTDPFSGPLWETMLNSKRMQNSVPRITLNRPTINRSFISFKIQIHNTGSSPLEEYKLLLNFEGNIQNLSDTNVANEALILSLNNIPTTFLNVAEKSGKIVPKKSILVGDDNYSSAEIYLKPDSSERQILIKWKLISKDFKKEGILNINLNPDVISSSVVIYTEDIPENKVELGEIEDCIEYKYKP